MGIPEIGAIVTAQQAWRRAATTGDPPARAAAEKACALMPEAMKVLAGNLASLGYPRVDGRVPAMHGIERRIRKVERALQMSVPPALKIFWRVVGGVSFIDVSTYAHVRFWEERGVTGPHGFSDGVHVDGCSAEWLDYLLSELDGWRDDRADGDPTEAFEIPLSPDGLTKDNVSGGEPYAVAPGDQWLARLDRFRWCGAERPHSAPAEPCDLLGYLRTAILECAGFPGLLGVSAFEPMRLRLLDGVPMF